MVFKRKQKDLLNSVHRLIGKKCIVTQTVDNTSGCGMVKIKKSFWAAKSMDDRRYDVGTKLLVVSCEGVKLICRIV